MTGFGLAHQKRQGCAMHPDDMTAGNYSDETYYRQLKAYRDDVVGDGVFDEYCSRPHLLEQLRGE